jgi:hypothetical protein
MITDCSSNRSPTWKWVAETILAILLIICGYMITDVRSMVKDNAARADFNYQVNQSRIERVQQDKLDKAQYYNDLRDIKDALRDMNNKQDRILTMKVK